MSPSRPSAQPPGFRAVIAVASLGGLPPLTTLVAGLPASFPVPLLILQHRHPSRQPDTLAWLLGRHTALPVRTASDGMPLRGPGVTVIPAGHTATAHGRLHLQPTTSPAAPERTDADTLLASAATPGPVIAVVLSGRMRDGARGVQAIKRHSGRVLVQDPATAQAPGMPTHAIATGCADFILPPPRIPTALTALAMAPGGAQLLTVPLPHWAQLSA